MNKQKNTLLKKSSINSYNEKIYEHYFIASTFTAEPIEESLRFWSNKFNKNLNVNFAPYNHVFQELLNPRSMFFKNSSGINIILLRIEDWIQYKNIRTAQEIKDYADELQKNTQDLINGLKKAVERSKVAFILAVCPSNYKFFEKFEQLLYQKLKNEPGIYIMLPDDLLTPELKENFYDPQSNSMGHIPYTDVFFTHLGTSLIRKIEAVNRKQYKVIVLDCDNTLWKGIIGEDLIDGIILDEHYMFLQEFMVKMYNKGFLLTICSKNNEKDVMEVFENRKDMILNKEHFTAWKINWERKSQNIISLAAQLKLGLDSFIFIDDSPVECLEVKTNCPGVLTIQIPENREMIQIFLENIWAFDILKVTEADNKRSDFYKQNLKREKLKEQSLSFKNFLDSLELEISINSLKDDDLSRLSQMTMRTNQFNATTIRRDEKELKKILENGYKSLITSVKDRFGDYGIVGAMIYKELPGKNIIEVDTFLLSCRAMGRGVEYKMINKLAEIIDKEFYKIRLKYIPTERNKPILDFFNNFAENYSYTITNNIKLYDIPVEICKNIDYVTEIDNGSNDEKSIQKSITKNKKDKSIVNIELMNEIASTLNNPYIIIQKINEIKNSSNNQSHEYIKPKNENEKILLEVCKNVLGIKEICTSSDFFKIGGDSLRMIRVINKLQHKNINIEMNDFYKYKIISEISKHMVKIDLTAKQKIKNEPEETTFDLLTSQLWFVNNLGFENEYNIHTFLHSEEPVKEKLMEKAFYKIVDYHDSLRCLYFISNNTKTGINDDLKELCVNQIKHKNYKNTVLYSFIDLQDKQDKEIKDIIIKEADKAQEIMNVKNGPVCRMVLFRTHNGDHIFIVMNHLAGDGRSLDIIVNDILTVYIQLAAGSKVSLPGKTTPISVLAKRLKEYALSKHILNDLDYWNEINNKVKRLPVDYKLKNNDWIYKNIRKPTFEILNNIALKLFSDKVISLNLHISNVLMAAWGLSIKKTFNYDFTCINIINNGRNWIEYNMDFTRTTGWFTYCYPVLIDMKNNDSLADIAFSLKNSIDMTPGSGKSYQVLRDIRFKNKEFCREINLHNEILFIFHGELDLDNTEVFKGVRLSPYINYKENLTGDHTHFAHKFLLNLFIRNNQLVLEINYNEKEYNKETILKIGTNFKNICTKFVS